ncbi:MAG: hypothetical protein V7695_10405 [Sulfitobacter sp.]
MPALFVAPKVVRTESLQGRRIRIAELGEEYAALAAEYEDLRSQLMPEDHT